MVGRIMIKKQLVGITFYAIVIYFTCGLLASAFAVSHPLLRDGTHFCGVTHDQPRWHRVSKGLDNRNYARTFANLNVGQPRTVRLIYFLPNDRTSQPDIDAKMDELIKEAQQVFAGQMDYYGFGRKTFRFETDVNRKAVVHHVNGRFPDVHYQTSAWTKVEQEVSQRFDLTKNIYLIALDVSSEVLDGSWCGQGGYMEPDGGMTLIPASGGCFEESDVTVHELGHAFGLLHDFRNDLKPWIDLYSTEPMTTSRCANEWLAGHRYFNVRQTDVFDESTTIQMEPFGRAGADSIELSFDITDVNGLHQAQLFTTVEYLNGPDLGIFDCKTLKGNSSPVEFIVPISELAYRGEVDLQVIDAHGNFRQEWYPIDIASLDPIAFVADASPTYSSGELIPTLPTGSYFPNVLAGGSFQSSGGVITITFRNDGLMVVDGITYTCVASGGCRIDGRTVTQGLIQVDGTEGAVPVDDENIMMDTDVDIPDPNLRAAIESALGKASGASILLSDMANLTVLEARNAGISDLTGLEYATNLRELDLRNEFGMDNRNSVSDLSPLAGLTNLRVLNLRNEFNGNSVSDLSPLAGLTNLTSLNLDYNSITDISAVAGLTNLTWLSLWSNSITDISAVAGLTNLTYLGLTGIPIVDLSPLAGLTNLTSLDLWDNNITDISPLAGLTNLVYLYLLDNRISDLSPLAGLTNLFGLDLQNNAISDLSPLVANTGVGTGDWVSLRNNPLSALSISIHIPALQNRGVKVTFDAVVESAVDIPDPNLRAAIEGALGKASGATITTVDMERLTYFYPGNANISDLTGLEAAPNLKELNLGGEYVEAEGAWINSNSISDLSPLAGLTNLTELYLDTNNITDISAVSGLTNLVGLHLYSNAIVDLSPVAGLTNLVDLGLGDNSIVDISAVAGLTNLTYLDLGVNSIVDLSPLAGLTNLTYLVLWDNNITDISPLVANTGFGSGDKVDVGANPLSFTSINTHIPALQSRGVEVFFYELKPPTLEYTLSIPAGISLIHVPLKVSAVDGVEQPIESVGDLYDVLGGASTVNYLITYDSPTQAWLSYFSSADSGTLADRTLTDDMGIIAGMKAPVSVSFTGEPLGTGGSGSIHLNQGLNVVGLPLNDSRLNRVSNLLLLDGISGNVPVIILTDGGEFKTVGRSGDPGDIPLTGGRGFILTAQRAATVALSGEGWTNDSGAGASPSITRKGIDAGNRTPVLELRGAVVDEHTGVSEAGFRVTVKNLSTDREVATVTRPDDAGYRLTVVDIETGHAAGVGDILEISARTPDPSIGVQPLRYTVTAEDVLQSFIQLEGLVAYEIPTETVLLANYPNPFNPETWIPYHLASDADVQLTIYDINGGVVRRLDFGHQPAGYYTDRSDAAYWDGRNDLGGTVGSGVYFYHLSAGEYSATKKMVILK